MDLAIYNLYARRSDSTPEIREKRYDAAVKFLEQIAKGTISMGHAGSRRIASDQRRSRDEFFQSGPDLFQGHAGGLLMYAVQTIEGRFRHGPDAAQGRGDAPDS